MPALDSEGEPVTSNPRTLTRSSKRHRRSQEHLLLCG